MLYIYHGQKRKFPKEFLSLSLTVSYSPSLLSLSHILSPSSLSLSFSKTISHRKRERDRVNEWECMKWNMKPIFQWTFTFDVWLGREKLKCALYNRIWWWNYSILSKYLPGTPTNKAGLEKSKASQRFVNFFVHNADAIQFFLFANSFYYIKILAWRLAKDSQSNRTDTQSVC